MAAGLFAIAALLPLLGVSETRTVLLLHTNDLHDHVRVSYGDQGGLPFVASYVRSVRAERDDVLLLDAGDVQEKGDWVAHLTQGQLIYGIMAEIGYDAVVPGNHDIKAGLDHLDQCETWLGRPFVCANILRPDGTPRYAPSHVFTVNGVRVGVIGLTRAGKSEAIPEVGYSKKALAEEAAKLEGACDVLVALIHEGAGEATQFSKAVPAVDVFVTGHTHQSMREPRIIEDTGAIMVQTGAQALYVGRLELTVDTETGEIVAHKGGLVPMDHAAFEPDPAVVRMVAEAEAENCPNASEVIAHSTRQVGMHEVSQIIAEALREALDADVALAMTDKVARNMLPEGDIDNNAVFRAMAPWALDTMTVEMTGAELLAYIEHYAGSREEPHWSGVAIDMERGDDRAYHVAETDVDPARTYRVAVTVSEWDRALEDFLEDKGSHATETSPVQTDAVLRSCLKSIGDSGTPVSTWAAERLRAASK